MSYPFALSHDAKLCSLNAAVAQRLQALAVEVEALGADLCADEHVVQRHLVGLQGIDRLAQNLNQIVAVLTAADADAAVEAVALQDLNDHLNDALWTGRAQIDEESKNARYSASFPD